MSSHSIPSTVKQARRPIPKTVLTFGTTIPIVSVEQSFTEEDKVFLYAVLQEIANELRRINREHKKHQKERNP
jgi:hypothetical protein